jgi:hypothetical protein
MSLRSYLLGLSVSSSLCWIAWVLTIVNTNPGQGGQPALLSFYISFFFALLGTLTLVGYFVRRYRSRNEQKYAHIRTAFRQGALAGVVVVAALLLQATRLASWWDILLLVLISSLLELYLRSYGATRTV